MSREFSYQTKNGIKIYAYNNNSLHGFHISLFLRAGSMYEKEEEIGITHFLEHIAIRNVNAIMNGKLYSTLDKYGIEFNASSYSEMVQFYVSGAKQNFSVGAQILSLLLSPIILSADEISAERDRIKAEIRESDEAGSLSSFANKIIHAGTSLAYPITGTLGSVSKINRTGLERYRQKIFTKDTLFIYVTGAFGNKELDELASAFDKPLCECKCLNTNVAPVSEKFGKREEIIHIKNADFTMLRFSFDMDMSKITMPEGDLLYDILLGGYNSRFYIDMSEKKGLFYDITGSNERYKNIGVFTFSFEVRSDKIYEALENALEILEDICRTAPLPEECMKAGYVDNAKLLYDDMRELNFTFAYDNHIMGARYKCLDERADAYRRVTPQRIREVASELFRRENLTLAIKANKKKVDVDRLMAIISSFREEKEKNIYKKQ